MTLRDTKKYEAFKNAFLEEFTAFQEGLMETLSTNKEWARALSLRPSTITRYLKTLVLEGLVNKKDLAKRMNGTKRQSLQITRAIKEMVQEIKQHQNSEIQELRGNEYYAQLAGITAGKFSSKIRSHLPKDMLDYRATQLGRQFVQSKWPGRRKKLSEIIGSVPEEIKAHRQGLIERLRTNTELAQLAGIKSKSDISEGLNELVSQGKLTKKDRVYRKIQIRAYAKYHRDQASLLETRRRISEAKKGKKRSPLSEQARKRISEAKKGKRLSEETKEKLRQKAIENKSGRAVISQKRYEHEGIYYASKTELATAQALEKYIPGYKTIQGETFQVQGDTNCWFDFLLPGTGKIIEWHPVDLRYDGKRLLPFDSWVLQESRQTSKQNEKAFLYRRRVLRADLATEYWMQRQEAVNNSQVYRGNEVIHVRTPGELYDLVISEYADPENIPIRPEFLKEFEELTQKAIPVKKK